MLNCIELASFAPSDKAGIMEEECNSESAFLRTVPTPTVSADHGIV